ncbi:GTP-binding protein Era [Chitinivorax tropicus]|uniref:GTPase Era n=1 Tax=Chitinivorax tropicus TaxID=714531 RepID=A0A840MNZ3_9PROT|nr:GTP-binding protein Era [Chitinivorax tropicus]
MSSTEFRAGFVAIVGRPNVGKSTLLNQLIGQKISITSRKAQTTRHRVTGIYTDEVSQFVFVDTPGFQTRHRNAMNDALNQSVKTTLGDVDAILFVVEAMKYSAADAEVLALLPKHRPVWLVINKIDKHADKGLLLPFIQKMAEQFAFAGIVPISAEKGTQIPELLNDVRPHLPVGEMLYPEDQITDRNERFLAAEIVREKLFRLLGEELPYSINVEIEKFDLDGALRRIYAAVYVDKPNQKAIIIGKGGEKLKRVSSEARVDMELLFDGKVYLEVWVKVKSGWADDVRFLKQLTGE